MENLNNANSQTPVSNTTLVCIEEDLHQSLFPNNSLQRTYQYKITKNNGNIFFQEKDNFIHIKIDIDSERNFKVSKKNCSFIFEQILKAYHQQHNFERPSNKNTTSFNKNNDTWLESHMLLIKLNKFLRQCQSIKDFTQSFFHLEQLASFKTIHLFIHPKGSTNARHIQIKKERHIETSQNVKDFTSLFQAIKKSKNRSFGQSTLKASNFQIIGTCIGHEFSLDNHNLILLISKDDFLPQSEADIDFFKEYKDIFKNYFEILLNVEFNIDYSNFILDSINKLPDSTLASLGHISDLSTSKELNSLMEKDYSQILKTLREKHFNLADINHQERIILLGELLNTLKHELSNPLFGLRLSTELLLAEELEEDQKEFMQHIHSNIVRSQSIIENFSGLYQDKKVEIDTNINKLLEEVFTLTKSESKQVLKQIASKEETNLIIKTNPTYLAQIIFNLIINSAQAMKEAQINEPKIEIFCKEDTQSITLKFQDNGPGIPSEKAVQVFDPFYTTKKSGTGLGLSISRNLAEKINGTLSLIPSEVGACFELRIKK